MLQPFDAENDLSPTGFPAGGYANAVGVSVEWQARPLGEEPDGKPTGAFVETLIAMVIQRIEFYQSMVPCRENELALMHLDAALAFLNARTQRRIVLGVEGTHEEPGDGTLADQIVP